MKMTVMAVIARQREMAGLKEKSRNLEAVMAGWLV
jgi:hypothetical protein